LGASVRGVTVPPAGSDGGAGAAPGPPVGLASSDFGDIARR
jgi:hypothetical protein